MAVLRRGVRAGRGRRPPLQRAVPDRHRLARGVPARDRLLLRRAVGAGARPAGGVGRRARPRPTPDPGNARVQPRPVQPQQLARSPGLQGDRPASRRHRGQHLAGSDRGDERGSPGQHAGDRGDAIRSRRQTQPGALRTGLLFGLVAAAVNTSLAPPRGRSSCAGTPRNSGWSSPRRWWRSWATAPSPPSGSGKRASSSSTTSARILDRPPDGSDPLIEVLSLTRDRLRADVAEILLAARRRAKATHSDDESARAQPASPLRLWTRIALRKSWPGCHRARTTLGSPALGGFRRSGVAWRHLAAAPRSWSLSVSRTRSSVRSGSPAERPIAGPSTAMRCGCSRRSGGRRVSRSTTRASSPASPSRSRTSPIWRQPSMPPTTPSWSWRPTGRSGPGTPPRSGSTATRPTSSPACP